MQHYQGYFLNGLLNLKVPDLRMCGRCIAYVDILLNIKRFCMQNGKTAEAETAVRRLWGKAKVESSMADLKASSVETVKGDTQDASWGELFGKRYRKGISSGIFFVTESFALFRTLMVRNSCHVWFGTRCSIVPTFCSANGFGISYLRN